MPRVSRKPQDNRPWPSCPTCGGHARPDGEPTFRVRFEVETRSEANARDTWGKIKRAEAARKTTTDEIAVALGQGQQIPEIGPWYVRLTRISRGTLDDDNLGRAMKAVQDTVAAAIGVDDGSPRIAWKRAQIKDGAFLGVIVEIWSANIS